MSGLDTLKTRLEFIGGDAQIERMRESKLASLRKAILASYQSAIITMADERDFRGLINPDQQNFDYDNKIISMPYTAECLNIDTFDEENSFQQDDQGLYYVDIKCGDVITWKNNQTFWLVFLQKLEETAYFRAELRQCKYITEINGKEYRIATKFKNKETISWKNKDKIYWNNLDYQIEMYITKDDNTLDFFNRFKKIVINNKNWEVQAVESMDIDGVIVVALKEDFSNTIQDEIEKEKEEEIVPPQELDVYIEGETSIYPYDIKQYKIIGTNNGVWSTSNEKIKILSMTDTEVEIEVTTGRSGSADLKYTMKEEEIVLPITINSL